MAKKSNRTKKEDRRSFLWRGRELPLLVVWESRRSIRMALGKKEIILRLPSGLLMRPKLEDVLVNLGIWLDKLERKKPGLMDRFEERVYADGQMLQVGSRRYALQVRTEPRLTHTASLKKGIIELRLADSDGGASLQKNIRTLLSRVVASDFLPEITRRTHQLNELHFSKPIKSVTLRYAHGRWGSCSSSGRINFSTRLLFAPPFVVDYVIIHELAHLLEHNHSDRYWKIVEKAMPAYEEAEKWLKENGHQCDF
ncbi:MAG: M48 family metallopeptidase [Lewinellaceae bacterium]|nr:M48 family metallopeptidase [Lewinella sp.]MCB9278475.1 M48 family metallopeptidase [Lewinellaceae bacterium]